MTRRLVIAAVAGVTLIATAGIVLGWSWQQLNAPLALPDAGMRFEVERGAALARITSRLEANGVLEHPRLLDWYARFQGTATGIQAGEYQLSPGLTGIGLLAMLGRGDVYLHRFTIIEGWRFDDLIERLREHPAITATGQSGPEVMAAFGKPDMHPEGQFLPDTYSFPRGTSDLELLGWAHEALWSALEDEWRNRPVASRLEDPYEALILASIIEKETALDSERGLISGVLHERLRRGMRLQVDPTVIYGAGDAFTGDLTRAQLNTDTPYNTYTRAGLPPTPIALAGLASIQAAIAPVESGALYFVATGDADGSHVFSETLEQHNAAVGRYLARQRAGDGEEGE
jgi:UPF0755 protein